jgi:glyoxylase-like metal-dependent hydrolase (beta-lactamase superfamily II)
MTTMRTARIALGALLGLCLVLGLAFGRGQETKVETQAVGGKVSVLFGDGGNIGVSSGPDGILIVDDQFERLAQEIEAALAKLAPAGGSSTPRFLVNTHHHGDHTDGNKHFGKQAVVVAHENVRARLLDEKAPVHALPIVTYADGLALHWNGEEIRLIHVPEGHTDGDSVVWFKGSNVIHLGDLYFQLGYPFVDTASGGNVLGLAEGLRALLPELPADIRVIPGHGKVTGKAELEQYVAMLETITERVRTALEQGKDSAAMIAAGVTKDFDERWGHFDFVPPERFVQSVIDSLR